jgi:hypothetical protein
MKAIKINVSACRQIGFCVTLGAAGMALTLLAARAVSAQNPQLQERVAEIKQSMAANKQALAQYSWQEQRTISIKGEVKKQLQFLVRVGPDGKDQKQEIDPQDQSSGGRQHGLKHRIKERKKEEYEEYGEQIASLAQQYTQQEPGRLQQLYDQGNVMFGSAGAPGEVRVVIQGYVKPGDSVTIIYGQPQRAIQSLQINSYLNDPSDAVKITAQFAQLPNGPNHAYDVLVNGVSKQLTVEMQNSNYQRM